MKTKNILTILAAIVALLCASTASATTYYSRASGNWNINTTWSTTSGGNAVGAGVFPGTSDDVIIERAFTVTVNITDAACTSVQLGGTATANAGTLTFAVSGSPALAVSGAVLLGNSGNTARDGIITFTSGSSLIAGSLTVGNAGATPGQGTITMTAGGTLTVGGAITVINTGHTWTPGAGTVKLTANNTLPALFNTFYNLTITGGTTTLSVDTAVTGVLTVGGGAALNASNVILTFSGAGTPFVVTGTFTPSTSTVSYTSTTGAALTGTTYNNLNINGSSDTFTLNGNATVNGTLTLASGDTLADAGYTLTVKGNLSNSGTHSGAGKILLAGTSAQTLAGTFGNVELNNAAGASLSATTTINGTLTVTAGTFTAGAFALTVNGATTVTSTLAITSVTGAKSFADVTVNGTWNNSGNRDVTISGNLANNGTFTAGTGAYTLSGSSKTISGTISLTALTITTGTKAISGALTVSTTLTLTSGGLTSAGSLTLGNGATISRAAGTLDAVPGFGASVNVTYTTGTAVTTGPEIPTDTSKLINLTVNNTSGTGVTLGAPVTVNGNLNFTGGELNTSAAGSYSLTVLGNLAGGNDGLLLANNSTITIGGNFTGTGTFTAGTSTIVFSGGGAHSIPTTSSFGNFHNLTIDNSGGTATLVNLIIVDGDLTITAGTLATANYAVTLKGNFSNSGTFTAGNSAITIDGTGTQTIAGFTTTGAVSMTKNGGTATFNGNVNGGGLTINGTGGTLNLGSGLTHTFTGTWTRTAGTLDGGSSTLKLGNTTAVSGSSGTFTAGSGTVEYNAAGGQTIAVVTYNNLIFSGSGAKTMSASTAVSANLSIAPTGSATASVATGQNLSVGSLTLGGLGKVNGTWGSTSSSPAATYQNNTYFAATTGKITVGTDTRSTPTITTAPSATAITYGQTLASSSLSGGIAQVSGSFTFTTPGTAPSAGTEPQGVTFTPADPTSYTTAFGSASVTVNARVVSLSGTRAYNSSTTAAAAILSVANKVGSDDVTVASGNGTLASKDVGSQAFTSTGTLALGGTAAVNYTLVGASGSVSITTAALSITADSDTKMYGDTKTYGAGSTAFTSSGLQSGETIGTVSLACSGGGAAATVAGSPYTITPSAATGGTFSAANYNITYNPGTLQVLTAVSVTSGSAALPGFTAGTIPVTVVASDSSHNALGTSVVVVTTGDSGKSFTLTIGVPSDTKYISLKPRFYLRELIPLTTPVTTEDTVTLDMTGVAFVGGDADGKNQVNGTDYAWLRYWWSEDYAAWALAAGSDLQYDMSGDGTIDANDFPDLDGNGAIGASDYSILKDGWYQAGEAE